ncbi:MAG: tetratricopeptide repeat protein [Xanthomonadales bacterium]|jgi:tetratricopeptide (TPR) repeat protein|nr:tetratricopeptide repeat protein [Xanthomonadales bacterium]
MTSRPRKPRLILLLLSFLVAACASAPADPQQDGPGNSPETAPAAAGSDPAPTAAGTPAEDSLPPAPDASDEVAYKVWSAEVFGQEGQWEKAAAEYLAAALMSDDPDIAKRATEVAVSAQAWPVAAMAADRWTVLAPDDLEARETAARALLVGGDYVRAELQMLALLERLEETPWGGWARIPPLLASARNVERTLEVLDHLETERDDENNPYARYARSRVLARASEFEEAYELARQAVELGPNEAELHTWAARLSLTQRNRSQAAYHYRAAWRLDPTDRDRALAFAELLRQAGEPEEAMDVLASLPDTPENRFTRIAFATESGRRPMAEDLYRDFDTVPYPDQEERDFQAARSAEVLDFKEEAIAWYARLEGTRRELISLLRRAYLLSELDRVDEARQLLRLARNGGAAAVQLESLLVEAQILSEAGREPEAFGVLAEGLEQFPGDGRLLYTRALVAVQLDRIDQAEADLREVLAKEPRNAAALNALGYTLADRTDRYDEAEDLIRRAYQLEPEDAAIIDSMGWVAYRQGRLEEAERYLRQALLRQRNAEIAAHLGEVLWAQGRQDDARRVWNEAVRMDPADPVLRETLDRFGVEF